MREIKFKAWDKIGKRMGEVNYIKYSNVQYNQVSARFKQKGKTVDEWFNYGDKDGCDNVILMQYTGLRDKNGVEIYEGDIVREQRKRFKDRYFVVEWLDRIGSYSFQPVDKEAKSWPCFNFGSAKNLEIVGNIYKNKELLEGSK